MGNRNHKVNGNQDGRERRHGSQMSHEDKQMLIDMLRSNLDFNGGLSYDAHARGKRSRGDVSFETSHVDEILAALEPDHVIEYSRGRKNGWLNQRLVIRNNDIVRPNVEITYPSGDSRVVENAVLCLVVQIEGSCLITAYWNDIEDDHDSIDMARYT